MSLYEILVNRACIWVLKELYEAEVVNKKVYSARVSELRKSLNMADIENHIDILEKNGLLHVDSLKDDKVVSLNQKGKDFFKLFDKLKVLTESQVKIVNEKPFAKVEYDLTDKEKKALLAVFKVTQDVGDSFPINSLIVEDKQQEAVYDKLQKLNLIVKIKKGKGYTVEVTPTGKKIVQQEFSEKLK